MWLVVSQVGDAEASLIAARLSAYTTEVLHVTSDELVHGAVWRHRLGVDGVQTTIVLGDGRVISDASITAVVNRLVWLTADGFVGATADDREYATGELQALALSWLASLGERVVNPPSPLALCGEFRPAIRWRRIARHAGIAVASGNETPAATRFDTLFVDGVELSGRPGEQTPTPTVFGLSDTVGLTVFEARYVVHEGQALLEDIGLLPAFTRFGEPAVEALAIALESRAAVVS